MINTTKRIAGSILGCLAALALIAGIVWTKAEGQGKEEAKAAIPAGQVIACITTAIAAKPGDVRELEAEREKGKTVCEVEILAEDGKTYEVVVDVATNTVIEVEADDDDDKDDKDEKEN